MKRSLALGGIVFAAACSSAANPGPQVTCGSGTTEQDGVCVASGSGSGGDTCGAGTHLDGTTCVPDGSGPTAAPAITGMTPDHAGITGNTLFQIKGTGFAGSDVTDLHVYFGDTTPSTQQAPNPCEAVVGAATGDTIAGQVPGYCFNPTTLALSVTVTTNKGMATTPFHYDTLYAADSSSGTAQLWMIDPYASLFFPLGTVTDATDGFTQYGLASLAFDSTGALWGVTTPDATLGTHAKLVKLAVLPDQNGLVAATVVGNLSDAAKHVYTVSSIKVSGTTMYGWATRSGGTTTPKYGLVSIDTTTGVVAAIGTGTFHYSGSLALDANNVLYVAPDGAGADANVTPNTTGVLSTVDTTTGALTTMANLDYAGVPVTSMTYVGTTLIGSLDYNAYATMSGLTVSGAALAVIDPTAQAPNTIVTPAYELPAPVYAPSNVDAMDMAPTSLVLARKIDARWQHMGAAQSIAR
jgi:hypothetical protein